MFGFKKDNKKSERHGTLSNHPLVDILMENADYIMENGYINEDSIAFVKMTVDTTKMNAQHEMDLHSFVVNECEKMMINCKDERFRKMEEDIVDKMKKKVKDMRNDHDKVIVSYDKLIESLSNVVGDMKNKEE